MPIIKSAKKRVRTAAKQRVNNVRTKRSLREKLKNFTATVETKKDSSTTQSEAFSAIDTAVKKGVISKNKAARKKRQLNTASKENGGIKAGAAKKATAPIEKTAAKKVANKKSTPKPAAKKSTVKKKAATAKTTKK